jgi:murein DD-endopeptidase MepM/ murein hydrolase activator NlpD
VRGFGFIRRTRPDLIHRGADISAPEGSVIRAAADGIVAYSDNGLHGYGNVVLIVHRNGWMTLYAHASRTTVQAGYRVRRGERIALVGQTGIAHGPHVHFELWDRGHAIDPATLFDGGPPYIERLGQRAADHGDVAAPAEVTDADRPIEAPLAPHPDDRAHAH